MVLVVNRILLNNCVFIMCDKYTNQMSISRLRVLVDWRLVVYSDSESPQSIHLPSFQAAQRCVFVGRSFVALLPIRSNDWLGSHSDSAATVDVSPIWCATQTIVLSWTLCRFLRKNNAFHCGNAGRMAVGRYIRHRIQWMDCICQILKQEPF